MTGWVQLPNDTIRAAAVGLSPRSVVLWLLLRSYEPGPVRPAIETLSAQCDCSRATIKRCLEELEGAGWLRRRISQRASVYVCMDPTGSPVSQQDAPEQVCQPTHEPAEEDSGLTNEPAGPSCGLTSEPTGILPAHPCNPAGSLVTPKEDLEEDHSHERGAPARARETQTIDQAMRSEIDASHQLLAARPTNQTLVDDELAVSTRANIRTVVAEAHRQGQPGYVLGGLRLLLEHEATDPWARRQLYHLDRSPRAILPGRSTRRGDAPPWCIRQAHETLGRDREAVQAAVAGANGNGHRKPAPAPVVHVDPRRQDVWQRVLGLIEERLEAGQFHEFFRASRLICYDELRLVVAVGSEFARRWLADNGVEIARQAASEVLGRDVPVIYEVADVREVATA